MNGGANIRWAAQKAVRLGRPPTDLAAEVDLRISTAACELFLARELTQSNHATLLYEAREGGGSVFRIVFADPGRWTDWHS